MRPISVTLFAIASASPLAMIAASIALGGLWPLAALLYMTFAAVSLDLLIPHVAGEAPDQEFPAADALLAVIAVAALIALPAMTWAIAGPSGLNLAARIALFFASAFWFGQVAHPAAHELIHRSRPLFWLGLATYTALLFGHHTSAHRLVHHRFVASPDDPNSATEGETYYRFVRRAWPQSFFKGLQAENALRARGSNPGLHPYAIYVVGALVALAAGYLVAGLPGLLVWACLGLHTGSQILLSDYVQHYGLARAKTDGKTAPVTEMHSWNTPHWASSALMLNATRHSDHHAHPTRPYPALRLPVAAPMLPWPLPLACMIALYPPRWFREMRPVLAHWKTAALQD